MKTRGVRWRDGCGVEGGAAVKKFMALSASRGMPRHDVCYDGIVWGRRMDTKSGCG